MAYYESEQAERAAAAAAGGPTVVARFEEILGSKFKSMPKKAIERPLATEEVGTDEEKSGEGKS